MTDGLGESLEITARFARAELVRAWHAPEGVECACARELTFGLRTDLGCRRENNEDRADFYVPTDPGMLAARGALFVVADGMGGHSAGQIASEIAVKEVQRQYYELQDLPPAEALRSGIAQASEQVLRAAARTADRTGMGTTLTALALVGDRAHVVQIGDSRAYLVRDGGIRQVTTDHSWVEQQVLTGVLSREQAETSPYRNIITRAIGVEGATEPDLFTEDARAGDIWTLCSDGLTGHVSDDEIHQTVAADGPSEACRQLVALALSRGGHDNITVLVVQVGEPREAGK